MTCPLVLLRVVLLPAGLHLVVGTDNSLQAFDPHTMLLQWYVEFKHPPLQPTEQTAGAATPSTLNRPAGQPSALLLLVVGV